MSYSGIGSRTINKAISRLRRKHVLNRNYPDFAYEERVRNFSKCLMFIGIMQLKGTFWNSVLGKAAA